AEEHAAQALVLARERGTPSMQAAAHAALGLVASTRVDLDATKEHSQEAIRLARGADDREAYRTLIASLNNLSVVHQQQGEGEESLRLLLEALEIARRARNIWDIAFLNRRLVAHYFLWGDWQAAKRYLNENLRMDLSTPLRLESEWFLKRLEGDWEGAVSLARSIVEHRRRTGDAHGIFLYSMLLAGYSLELGRVHEARDAAAEAAGITESNPDFLFIPLVAFIPEALARGGDYERCEALCARGEALSRAANSPSGLAGALYGRAVLALERGDPDQAVRLFDEILPLAKRVGPVFQAHVLRTLARALIRRGVPGDLERGKAVLQECLMLLEQMGDTRKAQQVRGELAAPVSP
ncbi:MAG: tetratricopeptide repeat protein, partial [bacterium]